jgi:hypothetical protein
MLSLCNSAGPVAPLCAVQKETACAPLEITEIAGRSVLQIRRGDQFIALCRSGEQLHTVEELQFVSPGELRIVIPLLEAEKFNHGKYFLPGDVLSWQVLGPKPTTHQTLNCL